MRTITVPDYRSGRYVDPPTVTVQVVVQLWCDGRRNVRRADNGRLLGWIVRDRDEHGRQVYEGRAHSGAFRGDGPHGLGHVLDEVPGRLAREWTVGSVDVVAVEPFFADAVEGIVQHLVNEKAPAVGFGRHPAVKPYRSRA